jgi:hypothetical protein
MKRRAITMVRVNIAGPVAENTWAASRMANLMDRVSSSIPKWVKLAITTHTYFKVRFKYLTKRKEITTVRVSIHSWACGRKYVGNFKAGKPDGQELVCTDRLLLDYLLDFRNPYPPDRRENLITNP